MDIQTWYGTSVKIPTRSSVRYVTFATSCIGLVATIVRKKLDTNIQVRFISGGSASADQERGLININSEFLNGDFRWDRDQIGSIESLSAILGLIVHEAAHFAYSPPTLEPFMEHVEKNTPYPYLEDIAAVIGNIVEDIFIESEVAQSIPNLSWMLESLNKVLLNGADYIQVCERAKEIESPPQTAIQISYVTNTLLLAKVFDEVAINPYLDHLFGLALTARTMWEFEERMELTLQLYNLVMSAITEEEAEKMGTKWILEGISQVTSDRTKKSEPPKADRRITHEADLINGMLDRLVGSQIELGRVESEHSGSLDATIYIEKSMPVNPKPVEIDSRYVKLAQLARQRSSVNKPYGLNTNRGHSIRNLYKIATDSRIFAERVQFSDYQPRQVIIVIDYSGSMHWGGGSGISRLERAISAAAGAALGLVEGRCEVAVFGHTGDHFGAKSVSIYSFKQFREPIEHLAFRLDRDEFQELCHENRDGYALEYIARKFTGFKKKLLIHISDGCPMAQSYQGILANEHTRRVVREIRQRGIDVLSISIAEEARTVNDFIYGKEFNICNDDPNVLEQIVGSILT